MAKAITFRLQIQEPERTHEVALKQGTTTLGREPGMDIQLNYPKVSRKHARIECTDTMCMIFDEESANGTLVDGQRIAPNVPIPLQDNSVVEIDPVRIVCRHTVTETPDEAAAVEPPREQDTISRRKAQQAVEKEEKTAEKMEMKPPKPEKEEKPKAEEKPEADKEEPPAKPPAEPPTPPVEQAPEPEKEWVPPPGLSQDSIQYLNYLPSIYHNDFMSHFMAMFESILMPVEWNVDNFDLFLSPGTAPFQFLQWLSNWYDIAFNASWPEEKRRQLLKEAHQIYARRGTAWALARMLEIYTGQAPEIVEFEKGMEPHTFKVILKKDKQIDADLVIRLIDASKPAHTSYELAFRS